MFLAAATAGVMLAQQEPATPRFTGGTTSVVVPTTVTRKDGTYVNDLKPYEFKLFDNGKEQKIEVDVTFQPISLLIVMQANNTSEPVLPKLQKMAPILDANVLGERGEAGLMVFDHRVRLVQDFTRDMDQYGKVLQKVYPGSTQKAMIDAVDEGARVLSKRPQGNRKVMLLISETRDGGSQGKLRDALFRLESANVTLYSININRLVTTLLAKPQAGRPDPIPPGAHHVPGGGLQTPEEVRANSGYGSNAVPLLVEVFKQAKAIFVDNPQEVFTKYTGGRERAFVTQRDLERALINVGEELHSQYLISYSPNNRDEGGYHEIRIDVVKSGLGKQLDIRARDGYWVASKFDEAK
jgi:VWFA-related protein